MIFASVVCVLVVSTMASSGESNDLFINQGLNTTEYNGCAGIIIPSDNPLDDLKPERYRVFINKVKQIPDDLASYRFPDPAEYLARRIAVVLPFGRASDFAAFRIKPSNLRKIKKGTQELNQQELVWFYHHLNQLSFNEFLGSSENSDCLKKFKIIGAQIYDKYGTSGLHEIMKMNQVLAFALSAAWERCKFEGFIPSLPAPFQPN